MVRQRVHPGWHEWPVSTVKDRTPIRYRLGRLGSTGAVPGVSSRVCWNHHWWLDRTRVPAVPHPSRHGDGDDGCAGNASSGGCDGDDGDDGDGGDAGGSAAAGQGNHHLRRR